MGLWRRQAKVAELVDAHDSKSCTFGCEGSIPSFGTAKFVASVCLELAEAFFISSDKTEVICSLVEKNAISY